MVRAGLEHSTFGFQVRRPDHSATLCGWFATGANFLDPFRRTAKFFSREVWGMILQQAFFPALWMCVTFFSPLIFCMNFFWYKYILEGNFLSKSPTPIPSKIKWSPPTRLNAWKRLSRPRFSKERLVGRRGSLPPAWSYRSLNLVHRTFPLESGKTLGKSLPH